MGRALYIFGAGNFAQMAHHLFTTDGGRAVAGFVVDAGFHDGGDFMGRPVVAYEAFQRSVQRDAVEVFVALGVAEVNAVRARKVAQLQADGFALASFVSRSAHVPPGLVLHPNTMIMDQVNIHPNVRIGADTIVWSNSRIALNAKLGDHVWVTSAVIGDATEVGDFSFVGLNATVGPRLRVGRHNLIGAGALILQDTPDHAIFRGARSVASRVTTQRLRGKPLIR